jgi:hypothetical protein
MGDGTGVGDGDFWKLLKLDDMDNDIPTVTTVSDEYDSYYDIKWFDIINQTNYIPNDNLYINTVHHLVLSS